MQCLSVNIGVMLGCVKFHRLTMIGYHEQDAMNVSCRHIPCNVMGDLGDEANCCQGRAHVLEELLPSTGDIGVACPASIRSHALQSCWQVGNLLPNRLIRRWP